MPGQSVGGVAIFPGDQSGAKWRCRQNFASDLLVANYADRILSFDAACARVWARLMSPQHQSPVDKQIAAIALLYDLTVVTRKVDDFRGAGVALKKPFV